MFLFAIWILFSGALAQCPGPDHVLAQYTASRDRVHHSLANMTARDVLSLPCRVAEKYGPASRPVGRRPEVCNPASMFGDATTESRFRFARLPIFSPCQTFVSHAYGVIFARQPKSASTAIMDAAKAAFPDFSEHTGGPLPREYYVFTFVRNPWTRALSAHRMMNTIFLRTRETSGAVGGHCGVSFAAFARDAQALRAACSARSCCPYIDPYGGDPRPDNSTAPPAAFVPWFIDQHVNDQSGCAGAVDFVGRAEHAGQDWLLLVSELNKRGPAFPVVTRTPVGNPNGLGRGADRVQTRCDSFRSADNVRALALQYAEDVVRFGFL